MKRAKLHNGVVITFPDSMSQSDVDKEVRRYLGSEKKKEREPLQISLGLEDINTKVAATNIETLKPFLNELVSVLVTAINTELNKFTEAQKELLAKVGKSSETHNKLLASSTVEIIKSQERVGKHIDGCLKEVTKSVAAPRTYSLIRDSEDNITGSVSKIS